MTKKKKQKTNKLIMGPLKHFPCIIHQTSIKNWRIRKKERNFSLSRYIKGGKKSHLQMQLNF